MTATGYEIVFKTAQPCIKCGKVPHNRELLARSFEGATQGDVICFQCALNDGQEPGKAKGSKKNVSIVSETSEG